MPAPRWAIGGGKGQVRPVRCLGGSVHPSWRPGAGGKDRRIHRVLVTPSRVARANRVTSPGSVARCPPAIDSNALELRAGAAAGIWGVGPELLLVLQPRSVSI